MHRVRSELDQYWELLRQRRAFGMQEMTPTELKCVRVGQLKITKNRTVVDCVRSTIDYQSYFVDDAILLLDQLLPMIISTIY
ncbi:hypothetical protein [Mucilaginibacter sp. UYCu711]|uniref:hypothetical protein n=1 Tax=Mucilaginibacter sp. UYCu711 TaxID=3156339 RepID=UPI003D1D3108